MAEPDPWDAVRAHAASAIGWDAIIDDAGPAWVRGSARAASMPDLTNWDATAADVHQLLAAALEAGLRVEVDVEQVGTVVVRLRPMDGPGSGHRWAGPSLQGTLAWGLASMAGVIKEQPPEPPGPADGGTEGRPA
jgi:hypothetical protein